MTVEDNKALVRRALTDLVNTGASPGVPAGRREGEGATGTPLWLPA